MEDRRAGALCRVRGECVLEAEESTLEAYRDGRWVSKGKVKTGALSKEKKEAVFLLSLLFCSDYKPAGVSPVSGMDLPTLVCDLHGHTQSFTDFQGVLTQGKPD